MMFGIVSFLRAFCKPPLGGEKYPLAAGMILSIVRELDLVDLFQGIEIRGIEVRLDVDDFVRGPLY